MEDYLLPSKESHPRKAKVMSVHKNILDKHIGAAAML